MNKLQRLERLLPKGVPRYIRCYDNGGRTVDRYTVVYTGRYRKTAGEPFQYLGMSSEPFHPQGVGQHGESPRPIDVNRWSFAVTMGRRNHLGKRIPFSDLPDACQQLVVSDYKSLWNL